MSERMNKRQLIERIWIPISKRLPPDSDEYIAQVAIYNAKTGFFAVLPTKMAREYALEAIDGVVEADKWSWDRVFTHWSMLYPPEGHKTYEEHLANVASVKKAQSRAKNR